MITKDTKPEEAILVAIQREKAAVDFYTRAHDLVDDKSTAKMFQELAEEEKKHVARLEAEYDRFVAPEN